MNITAFFSDHGTPETGLTPTLDAWIMDGTLTLDAVSMTEIAGGWYYYNFSTYDASVDYVFRADGGSGLDAADRYKVSSNEASQIVGADGDTLKSLSDQLDAVVTNDNDNLSTLSAQLDTIVGADSDTLESLSDQLDNIHTIGTGLTSETYTITDSITGNPIGDVNVWATTDSAGENTVAQGRTNSSGTVTFYLNAGTYYFWQAKAGYNFNSANPTTVTVSA